MLNHLMLNDLANKLVIAYDSCLQQSTIRILNGNVLDIIKLNFLFSCDCILQNNVRNSVENVHITFIEIDEPINFLPSLMDLNGTIGHKI